MGQYRWWFRKLDTCVGIVQNLCHSGHHQNLRATRRQDEGGRTWAGRARASHQHGCDGKESWSLIFDLSPLIRHAIRTSSIVTLVGLQQCGGYGKDHDSTWKMRFWQLELVWDSNHARVRFTQSREAWWMLDGNASSKVGWIKIYENWNLIFHKAPYALIICKMQC